MMQYKVSPIDFVCSPTNAPLIRLWKANFNGSQKLPMGIPSPIFYCPFGTLILQGLLRNKSGGLSKYVDLYMEGGLYIKCNIWNEDEVVCWVLHRYFVIVDKTFISSTCHPFVKVLV
jgi:hypothetical protein